MRKGYRDKFQLLILGFVAFVTSFGAHLVAVNLPVYVNQVDGSPAMIGLLIAAYDLAEIAAKPAFSFIADRTGMKVTLLAGITVIPLALLAYFAVAPRLLLLIWWLQGLGAALLSTISAALVAEYFPARRGQGFGVCNAIKGAGYILNPFYGSGVTSLLTFGGPISFAAPRQVRLSIDFEF